MKAELWIEIAAFCTTLLVGGLTFSFEVNHWIVLSLTAGLATFMVCHFVLMMDRPIP